MAAPRPALVLIRGLPGSGKSYLATALVAAIGEEQVVTLDPDTIDYASEEYQALSEQLSRDGVDEKFHPYRYSRARAYAGIGHDQVIIWNQAFTNLDGVQKTVNNLQAYAEEHGKQLPVLVVEVGIDANTARQRIASRKAAGGHDVPDENFARFTADFRSFAGEGFPTVQVKGDGDINTSVAAVTSALGSLA